MIAALACALAGLAVLVSLGVLLLVDAVRTRLDVLTPRVDQLERGDDLSHRVVEDLRRARRVPERAS